MAHPVERERLAPHPGNGAPGAAAGARSGNNRLAAETAQYLTFGLGGEEYAANILQVREVVQFSALTRVPHAPSWIRGVLNLRGSVVPVVDLAVKFGQEPTQVTARTCIVLFDLQWETERTLLGVLAETVNEVVQLRPDELEPPPALGTHVRLDFLLGMARTEERFALVLDVDRVLSEQEIQAVERAQQGADPAGRAAADPTPGPHP